MKIKEKNIFNQQINKRKKNVLSNPNLRKKTKIKVKVLSVAARF